MASSQKKQKINMLNMLSPLFLLPLLAMATRAPIERQLERSDKDDCVYTFFVKTGDWPFAGTGSSISVALFDKEGSNLLIPDLKKIGIMGPDWDYFQIGNLDLFSGKEACLKSAPCKIALTSDGTGDFPDWLCSSVQVTNSANKVNSTTHFFNVNHWLTPDDPIYIVDNCPSKTSIVTDSHGHGGLPLPVQSESE